MEKLSIVLIGGTGFVGSSILRVLDGLGDEMPETRALIRGNTCRLKMKNVTTCSGDLFNIPQNLFPEKPYVVLHFATKQVDHDQSGYWYNNVEGTNNLLAHLSSKCAGIIYGSSMSVYGQGEQLDIGEDCTTTPDTELAKSRFAAERLIFQSAKQRGMSAYLLRPRFILGKGDKYTIPGIYQVFRSGVSIRNCESKYSIIDVDDYAKIVLMLIKKMEEGGPIQASCNIGLRTPLRYVDLEGTLIKKMRLPEPKIRVPLSKRTAKVLRILPGKKASNLATKVELFCQSHHGSVDRLEQLIGKSITSQNPISVLENAIDKTKIYKSE